MIDETARLQKIKRKQGKEAPEHGRYKCDASLEVVRIPAVIPPLCVEQLLHTP